ncbi:MAG TPA: ATP-binding protein, partial [Gallionella sp.]|nr:ATP-binding protein [Gallionella sp.]
FAEHVEGMYHISCEFFHDEHCRVDDQEVATHLFRITQEAVNNAVRHGCATSIRLRMSLSPSTQVLEILDNGCGLLPGATVTGLGLRSMRYRADLIGASMDVSALPEGGTRVVISMPIEL